MRFMKPVVSVLMALLISITSLGVSVSAHACSESGFSEAGLGHLKACCKLAEGKGFRAEPCCKVNVQHVKLATVRIASASMHLDLQKVLAPAATLPQVVVIPSIWAANQHFPAHPPESPPIASGVDAQALHCRFLI
jgi:hypothetical protein